MSVKCFPCHVCYFVLPHGGVSSTPLQTQSSDGNVTVEQNSPQEEENVTLSETHSIADQSISLDKSMKLHNSDKILPKGSKEAGDEIPERAKAPFLALPTSKTSGQTSSQSMPVCRVLSGSGRQFVRAWSKWKNFSRLCRSKRTPTASEVSVTSSGSDSALICSPSRLHRRCRGNTQRNQLERLHSLVHSVPTNSMEQLRSSTNSCFGVCRYSKHQHLILSRVLQFESSKRLRGAEEF